MELSADQIVIVGIIATVLTQVLKLVASKLGWEPGRVVVNIVLFVIAVGLGFIWLRPELPTSGDPAELARVLLEAALGVVGFASLIYNLLLEKVVYPAVRMSV